MKRALVCLFLLVPLLPVVSGCQTTPSGATSGMGGYHKTYQVTVDQAYNAALAMLQADKIPVLSKAADPSGGSIGAVLSDGRKLTIGFKANGISNTVVTMGIDKDRANYFFERLDQRLAGLTAQ